MGRTLANHDRRAVMGATIKAMALHERLFDHRFGSQSLL